MHKRDKNVYYFCTLIMVCAEILIESIFTGSIAEYPPKRNIKNEETPSAHLLVPSVSPIYHHFLRISGAVCAQ
jgi:hypothetical protein